jgi:predicted O-linked N-acetylglucosamine transferase (SPINDLY family)
VTQDADQLFKEGRRNHQFGRWSEAAAYYRRVLAINPAHPDALYSLGVAAHQIGRHDVAVEWIGQAIKQDRQNSSYFSDLGIALQALGKLDEAIAAYRQAIVVKPDNAEAHSNLGTALYHRGKVEAAITAYRQAIGIVPNYAEVHYNLGIALHFQGRIEQAIGAYRHAVVCKPDYVEAFCNLLFCQNYSDSLSAKQLFSAHREWDQRFGSGASRPKAYANAPDVNRRLRIGYVSPDFRRHSVAYFLAPLLEAHDRQAVEIFCYAEVSEPDHVTSHLNGLADHWLVTVGLSDKSLADRIQADGIDILVDLAGHSPNNRLRVFTHKPAPVQVTWLGYPNTTGLAAMDYRLVDAVTDPIGEADGWASETLFRLEGGFLCYEGSKEAPEPRARTRGTKSPITFGSFNNLNKISTSTLDAWITLLGRLPEAQLLLKGIPFVQEEARASFLARFRERGIAAERIELVASLPSHVAHLALHDRIDIALDTFPYGGTTTTCEALWMGVPVITLCGDRHAARVGASLLHQVGLTDLIAHSTEEYVEIAAALAEDSERLDNIHRSLRARMAASPLCDAHGFAGKIESAFRQMWQAWSEANGTSSNLTEALKRAAQMHADRKTAEAERLYQAILESQPNCFEALHMLGVIRFQQGLTAEAHDRMQAALKVNPTSMEVLSNLGLVLTRLGRPDEALASYDRAIAVQPDCAEALFNRANTLKQLGRTEEAVASYDKAIAIKPGYLKALFNRGNALQELERAEEALASYDRALAIQPHYVDALNNRGAALLRLKRPEAALASYDKAISVQPDCAEAHRNRGAALSALERHQDALKSFDRAIAIKPDFAEAWLCRGDVWLESDLNDQAIEDYGRALAVKPDCAEAIFAACIAELKIHYADQTEIDQRREAYGGKLRAISENFARVNANGDLLKAIAAKQPFYLAYQGRNDRDLQALYGSLVRRAVERDYPDAPIAAPPARGERVRVGFVSAFFREHSNWRIPIKGWLSQLDRDRFQVYGYYLGKERDQETNQAASLCERFVQGTLPVRQWRREILSDFPHVLIYPGLLMDGVSLQLAAQRLAPVQCNSWGHPVTSGLPTLDHYLSSDLMEPPDADRYYTERLVKLPNLSIYYEPIEGKTVPMDRSEFAVRPDATMFWCGQSLFKYLPQFDETFVRIAKAAPNSQFVFLRHHGPHRVTTSFQKRLERAFSQWGLSASDHCVFLDRLKPRQYAAAVGLSDVFLDSIGWSGCNSTMEAVASHRPIVTLPGPSMRTRHSAAILRMMGIDETIAASVDEFVSIAAHMANDKRARQAISRKMEDGKHRLYRDRSCIKALEKFLEDSVRQSS